MKNKISYDKFEAHLNSDYPYTGLVEGLGYVYWEHETIYFAKLYAEVYGKVIGNIYFDPPYGKFVKKIYKQISIAESFYYKMQRVEVISKNRYNIKIISPSELEFFDYSLYFDYYDGFPPFINKTDAIKSPPIDYYSKSKSTTPEESRASKIMGATAGIVLVLVADDATVVGLADDPLIPFIFLGGAIIAGGVWLYDNVINSKSVETFPALDVDLNWYDEAHKQKKQSSGKSKGDRHDRQYTHGGKNRPKNPNQRHGAEERRNVGKRDTK